MNIAENYKKDKQKYWRNKKWCSVVNNNNFGDTLKDSLKKNYDNIVYIAKIFIGVGNKIANFLDKIDITLYNLAMKYIHFIASTISFILVSITSIPQEILITKIN